MHKNQTISKDELFNITLIIEFNELKGFDAINEIREETLNSKIIEKKNKFVKTYQSILKNLQLSTGNDEG